MNTAESKIISSPKCHSVDSAVEVGDEGKDGKDESFIW